jgi:hypothetical protein
MANRSTEYKKRRLLALQAKIAELESKIEKQRAEIYNLAAQNAVLEGLVPAHKKKKDEPIGPAPHIELMPRRSGPCE